MKWILICIALALVGTAAAIPESTIKCELNVPEAGGEQFQCSHTTNMSCRAARFYFNETVVVVPTCFPLSDIATMYETEPVDDSKICGDQLAILCQGQPSENGFLPRILTCNTTVENTCSSVGVCTSSGENGAGICCSNLPQGEDPHRHKRSASRRETREERQRRHKERREEIERNRRRRQKQRRNNNGGGGGGGGGVEPFTNAPDTRCKRVTEDTLFDGPIVSVKVVKQLGYNFCTDKDYELKKKDRFFKIKDCKAVYKVCYTVVEPTTQAFTSPTPETIKKCIDLENVHGLVKQCPGKIVSVKYFPDKEAIKKKQPRGYGKPDPCTEGQDYFIRGDSKFIANNKCPGRFRVCHEEVIESEATTQALTTSKPETKCEKFLAKKDVRKTYDGKITRFRLLRELPSQGYYSDNVCKKGKNYNAKNNVFYARDGCRGYFKVCYVIETAAFTTESPEECEKIINVHGIKKAFPGDILSAKFIMVRQKGGYGKDTPNSYGCHKELDYSFHENFFYANARCVGFFRICWKPPKPTTEAFTTKITEPECVKVAVHKDGRTSFDGRIQSVHILKQIPVFSFGYQNCEEGKNYYVRDQTVLVVKHCYGLFKVCYFPGLEKFTTPEPTRRGFRPRGYQ